jgi:hypothetical protein
MQTATINMNKAIIKVAANQAAWFASAYGAFNSRPGIGIATCAASLLLGLSISENRAGLVVLALALGVYGFGAEELLLSNGLVSYSSPGPFSGIAPFWIVALWMVFAIVVNPLRWLRRHLILTSCLGATLAPLSYVAADRLGALRLSAPLWVVLFAIAAIWSAAMPGAIALDARLSRNESDAVRS